MAQAGSRSGWEAGNADLEADVLDEAGAGQLNLVERLDKTLRTSVVGVGHVNPLSAGIELTQQAHVGGVLTTVGHSPELADVVTIEGDHQVPFVEPGRLELLGRVVERVAAFCEGSAGSSVSGVTDVPVPGARAIDDDSTAHVGGGELGAKDCFGHRGAANVAHADEDHRVGRLRGLTGHRHGGIVASKPARSNGIEPRVAGDL